MPQVTQVPMPWLLLTFGSNLLTDFVRDDVLSESDSSRQGREFDVSRQDD